MRKRPENRQRGGRPPAGLLTLRLAVKLAALAAVSFGLPVGPQLLPNGPQFEVNTYTTGYQTFPAVAADGRGHFVVAWTSDGAGGTDTSSHSIHASRFDANGIQLGGEFQVNTYTTSYQRFPALASDGQGNFVVAWMSFGSNGTDTGSWSIQAQRFDFNGIPIGQEFQVNTYTTGDQTLPAVALGPSNFVVAWSSFGSDGGDSHGYSIQARLFEASGTPLGGEFQVNTYTTSFQVKPAVAADGQGNFVITWTSYGSSSTDTSTWSIQARRYNAYGTSLGDEFQVNTYTSGEQTYPAVALNEQGRFVVAWQSYGSIGTDTDRFSVQARVFEANGAPLSDEFQVNTYTTNIQWLPAVEVDSNGQFVVAWMSYGSEGTDTSASSTQVRRFDGSSTPLGGESQVNSYTTSYQSFPSVAMDGPGNLVVVWESDGSSGLDTSGSSIQAQLYDMLFRDGFETGDTGRWWATGIHRSAEVRGELRR